MKNYIILPFLLIMNLLFAQKKAETLRPNELEKCSELETQIAELSKLMVTDSFEINRIAAHDKLLPLVHEALAVNNSFSFAFDKVEHISILYPPDRSFRIITWQLFKDWSHYKYFGFIQLNHSKSKVYELKDLSKEIQKPENQILSAEKWFGSLYYNVRQFKTNDGMKYLLFGFNANDTIEKIKVVDVLTIKGGTPKFGSPVFEKTERGRVLKQNRLLFYHAFSASMRLNYDDEMGLIVHDHLQDIGTDDPNVPSVGVPDGTYEAYQLKKGTWQHIDKLKNTEMDEAPRPKPIVGKSKVVDKENTKGFKWPDEVKKEKN